MNGAEIGHWYRISVANDPVEVVALDDLDDTIELQHFEGEIEAMEITDWFSLEPLEVEAPEDWSGPYELDRQDVNPDQLFIEYSLTEALEKIDHQ